MNPLIRRLHRWLSILFTLAVAVNFVCLAMKKEIPWVWFLALGPLALLFLSGLYMLIVHYTAKGRAART